jgi:hypothetical protein
MKLVDELKTVVAANKLNVNDEDDFMGNNPGENDTTPAANTATPSVNGNHRCGLGTAAASRPPKYIIYTLNLLHH